MISVDTQKANVLPWPIEFDNWFAAFVLFLSSGAFLWLLRSQASLTSGGRTGELSTDVLWGVVYVVSCYRIFQFRQLTTRRPKIPPLLTALYLCACASALWSDAPSLTVMKLVALMGAASFAYYLSACFSDGSLLSILKKMFFWSIALSYAAVLLLPGEAIGTGDFAGIWQGIYSHKNSLGLNMALSLVVFASTAKEARRKSWFLYVAGAFAFLLLVLSQSSTSLMVCMICAFVFALRNVARRRVRLAVGALVIGLILIGSANQEFAMTKFLDAVDRDATLTGRTGVWGASLLMASERPWLGYGYGAFWRGAEGPSAEVWKLSNFEAFYSHNGFLDVLLDLGFLGVGLLIVVLFHYLILAIKSWWTEPTLESFWPILLWTYVLLSNLTEGSFLAANALAWILLLTTYLQLFRRTQAAEQ